MPQTNISVNDGKITPVAHVFVPASPQSGTSPARWKNAVTGFSSAAWEWLSTLVTFATRKGQNHRLNLTITLPVVDNVGGEEVLRGSITSYVTVICPYGLNTTDRIKDIFALTRNALSNAQVEGVLRDQNPSI